MSQREGTPPESSDDLFEIRAQKVDTLRELGLDPYPQSVSIDIELDELAARFEELAEAAEPLSSGGRIVSHNVQGKLIFINLFHGSLRGDAVFQVMARKNNMDEPSWDSLKQAERGDFLWVKGVPLMTRKGTPSIDAAEARLTCKSLRPWPFSVRKETELKMPELDMLTHGIDIRKQQTIEDEAGEMTAEERLETRRNKRENLRRRSEIEFAIHRLMRDESFVNVATPAIYPTYGGAASRPFRTEVWAHGNSEQFLSISPEPFLKRLVCGGLDRVYTLARNYRNEGIDDTHNPEFTGFEVYQGHADYTDMMRLTERVYVECATAVHGSPKIPFTRVVDGELVTETLDLTPPWPEVRFLDVVSELAGEDLSNSDAEQAWKVAKALGFEWPEGRVPQDDWSSALMALLDLAEEAEPKGDAMRELQQGLCHLKDYPAGSAPLCKRHRDDERLIERIESHARGMELCNGYTELNDGGEQRRRLEAQAKLRTAGDDEAVPMDELFVRSVELGLPPMGGLGIGFDRLVMLLCDADRVRDVIPFPMIGDATLDH
ncbi:MAG: amino acid--tRNA ligase-related protein [Acidobacteriota bacterium]